MVMIWQCYLSIVCGIIGNIGHDILDAVHNSMVIIFVTERLSNKLVGEAKIPNFPYGAHKPLVLPLSVRDWKEEQYKSICKNSHSLEK